MTDEERMKLMELMDAYGEKDDSGGMTIPATKHPDISDEEIRGTIERMIKSASKGKSAVSETEPFAIGEPEDARQNLESDRNVGEQLGLSKYGGFRYPEPAVSDANAEALGEELKRRRKVRRFMDLKKKMGDR
jgi:hypothetical protein